MLTWPVVGRRRAAPLSSLREATQHPCRMPGPHLAGHCTEQAGRECVQLGCSTLNAAAARRCSLRPPPPPPSLTAIATASVPEAIQLIFTVYQDGMHAGGQGPEAARHGVALLPSLHSAHVCPVEGACRHYPILDAEAPMGVQVRRHLAATSPPPLASPNWIAVAGSDRLYITTVDTVGA